MKTRILELVLELNKNIIKLIQKSLSSVPYLNFIYTISNRSIMNFKRVLLGMLSIFLCYAVHAQKKSNIIIFMVDDMGWQDTSYPFGPNTTAFNTRYHTPNMERLAKSGVAFTDAYSTPVCTPTRVSLITGMNASKHHVTNWTAPMKDNPTGNKDEEMEEPDWNYNGMSPIAGVEHTIYATPLAQILKDHGYFTIHAGKAHWGSAGTAGSNPYSLGFTVNIAGTSTGRPASYWGEQNFGRTSTDYHGIENLQEYFGQEINLTEALTREALKSLEFPIQHKLPFFLNLSHYALHDPLMEDRRYFQKYLDQGLSRNEAKYASMIESMDKSLGDVLDFLESKNIQDNTYIIFISDNGGLSTIPPRDGVAHTHNKPLRSGKGSIYEGGIRVPLMIKGIKNNVKNKRNDVPVIVEDIFPTVLDMAQIKKVKTVQEIDGISQLSALKNVGTVSQERPLVFHIPNKWTKSDGDGFNYRSAIRKGKYKLVWSLRNDSFELFDLEEDLGEQNNLIEKEGMQVIGEGLKSELQTILKNNKAPMPKRKGN